MSWLIETALSNALVATPLALLAWGLGRVLRRPALVHALWVLVLVKLVTPPLVALPLPAPGPLAAWWAQPPQQPRVAVAPHPAASPAVPRTAEFAPRPAVPDVAASAPTRALVDTGDPPGESGIRSEVQTRFAAGWAAVRRGAWPALFGGWLLGGLAWYAGNALRLLRFRRAVCRRASEDAALQRRTAELAETLGVPRVPRVRVVPGEVSPMLWGCGPAAQILLPGALLARLAPEGRDAVLLHELAHFRRGDHWVRLLELLVTGLYWWHPVTWWARRAIAATEERCCDAWVVDHLGAPPRSYAEALLETLDFIAARRPAPLASGVSDAIDLEQRLREIMGGCLQRSLSRAGRWLVVVGTVALPLQPFPRVHPQAAALAASSPPEALDLRPLARASSSISPPAEVGRPDGVPDAAALQVALPPPTDHPLLRTGPDRLGWGEIESASGRYRLAGLPQGEARVQDRGNGRSYRVAATGIAAARFVGEAQLLVGTRDGAVRLHDAASGEAVSFLGRHRAEVTALAASGDGRLAVTGAQDGSLFVWDLASGGAILWDSNVELPVAAVRISADGRIVAIAAGDWRSSTGLVLLQDPASGELLQRLVLPAPPGAVVFRRRDRALWAASWSGDVTVWDTATGLLIDRGRVAKESVSAAALLGNDEALADAAFDVAPDEDRAAPDAIGPHPPSFP